VTFQENQNIPRSHPGHGQGPAGASVSDVLTALQHIASNIAQAAQTYLDVNGQQARTGISSATLLKQGAGRVATVAVTAETGTAAAAVLVDSANANATAPVLAIIPAQTGIFVVNMPFSLGLVVIPGTGDTVSVSFS
jgi:hypothetical protein